MQARQVARELALLSLSQFSKRSLEKDVSLQELVLAAVRILSGEAQDLLAAASDELIQSNNQLFRTDVNAVTLESSKAMVREASELTRNAINRAARALEFPEMLQMTNQREVQAYALEISRCIKTHRETIDQALGSAMVEWRLSRLPKLDQDILRIAIAEMNYLGVPHQVSINAAVEQAKRYSDEEGKRFINGVLRRVVDARHSGPSSTEKDSESSSAPVAVIADPA